MCLVALTPFRAFKPKLPVGGAGFESFAAGNKSYGLGQRSAPNQGSVDSLGAAAGYGNRDTAAAARRAAIVKRAGM